MPGHTQHTNLTDEELLLAYRAGNDNLWLGYLLQRYTALLLGVALKYLKDKSLAEDAVQQVFLKALTHMPKEEILNFKGWLYVLMRNHCLQQLRDKMYHADEAALMQVPHTETDKDEIQWQEHTLQQVSEAVELLNEEQQKSIVLFYLEKCSYEQIIAQTGYSFMQVKSYIQNGKRNLKAILLKKQGNRPAMSDQDNILPFGPENGGKEKLSEERLMAYLDGKLSAGEQHEVEQWLAGEGMESDALEGLHGQKAADTKHSVNKLNHQLRKTIINKKHKRRPLKTDQFSWVAIVIILLLVVIAYIVIRKL